MTARTILGRKGRHVETASPDLPTLEAARRLRDKRIGCLVICDERGRVIGVLDERDIVAGLVKHGDAIFTLPVEVLMRTAPIRCAPEDDAREIMALMTTHAVRHVLVTSGHELQGLISIGDVVKSRLEETELEVNVLRDYARAHGRFPS